MKITLAENSGFCFGVRRALNTVNAIKNKRGGVYILGQLIHNPQVVGELRKKGIRIIENVDDIKKGTIVVSAHGVPDKLIKKAKTKGLRIIDTTCPLVKKVHNITKNMEKAGYNIIIFGDEEHTEVKGIKGNLKNVSVSKDMSKLRKLVKNKKSGIVSQTTQDIEKFKKVVDSLKMVNKKLLIEDTICKATKLRQKNSERLAKKVDLMIVIGGYNSANTKRLAQICSKIVNTKHIETADELKKGWFDNKKHVGVTAGASTPYWIINKVLEVIKNEF